MENKTGLWVAEVEDGLRVGLTKESQEDLGTISFVSLPKVGQSYAEGDALFEVEAEKAVSEFKSPVTGKVIAINSESETKPEILNEADPATSWIAVMEVK